MQAMIRMIPKEVHEKRIQTSKDECEYLGEKLKLFDIRFTKQGRIVTKDPCRDHYNTMARNHVKLLLKEWYLASHFTRRGQELQRFLDFFIDACTESCHMLTADGIRGEYVDIEERNIQ
jgi:hypothetical protein